MRIRGFEPLANILKGYCSTNWATYAYWPARASCPGRPAGIEPTFQNRDSANYPIIRKTQAIFPFSVYKGVYSRENSLTGIAGIEPATRWLTVSCATTAPYAMNGSCRTWTCDHPVMSRTLWPTELMIQRIPERVIRFPCNLYTKQEESSRLLRPSEFTDATLMTVLNESEQSKIISNTRINYNQENIHLYYVNSIETTCAGLEPAPSAVTGRRALQLHQQAILKIAKNKLSHITNM